MAAARQRAFNGRSTASESRSRAIATIQINWKQMRPDLYNIDESRDERLEWIGKFLGIEDLRSVTALSDQQLGAVAGEMKRLTGTSSAERGMRSAETGGQSTATSANIVTGDFGRNSGTPNSDNSETVFLASPEQVYTLDKLQTYLGWAPSDVFEFIKKRVLRGKARLSGSVPNFQRLTFRQATTATNALLHVAAHRDLKIRHGKDKPVSRVEINKYIPVLKRELQIDRRGA